VRPVGPNTSCEQVISLTRDPLGCASQLRAHHTTTTQRLPPPQSCIRNQPETTPWAISRLIRSPTLSLHRDALDTPALAVTAKPSQELHPSLLWGQLDSLSRSYDPSAAVSHRSPSNPGPFNLALHHQCPIGSLLPF